MNQTGENWLGDFQPIQCKLPLWKLTLRVIGVVLVSGLTVSLIVSAFTAPMAMTRETLLKQGFLYLLLFLFNSMIFLPAIFEVRMAEASVKELKLKTLFWQSRLDWKDVLEFRSPAYLKIAMLRTARCIYLIHKRDLTNYGQLAQIIKLKA